LRLTTLGAFLNMMPSYHRRHYRHMSSATPDKWAKQVLLF
jgi:hypothetical protein